LLKKEFLWTHTFLGLFLGAIGASFWHPFFLPYIHSHVEYVVMVFAKMCILATYGVRFTDFWYRFSGIDKKKLYLVAEAKDKFSEYRQIILIQYLKYIILI
jgi:hypothetical protein